MAQMTWYSVDRHLIGDLVAGEGKLKGSGVSSPDMLITREAPIAAAFAPPRALPGAVQSPTLFVIEDSQAAEVMSWLRVYDRPAFPLSQFCRVISSDDSFLLDADRDGDSSIADAWACVVLGELLAQGEYADSKLSSIPLAHAASSFSHVVARASLLHGRGRPVDICIRRLAALESDSFLGRKPMATRDLELIWGFLRLELGVFDSDADLTSFVADTLRAMSIDGEDKLLWDYHLKALTSDSVETRVLAFNSLLGEISVRLASRHLSSMEGGLYVAGAAFLAGRGTGHYFLLRRSGALFAPGSLWFGLLAGLRGKHVWDGEWLRAVKGIERQLRQTLVWEDPPMSDLGWLEYTWLAKNVSVAASLVGVARQNNRALAIEVLPGAVCQMRTSVAEAKVESQPAPNSAVESELRAALEQFLALSERTKKVLGRTLISSGIEAQGDEVKSSAQKSLFGSSKPRRGAKKS